MVSGVSRPLRMRYWIIIPREVHASIFLYPQDDRRLWLRVISVWPMASSSPNYATVSACASGTNALIDAFDLIRLGKSDMIVAGGARAAITIAGLGGFNAMNALSTRNDSPETPPPLQCKP